MIVRKKPEAVMEDLEKVYKIKAKGSPDYYLGNERLSRTLGNWM
jgi:hypothetical protein